jgi:4-amino-4-deoxy-L-arabinose transferase-like glycosyltransferase
MPEITTSSPESTIRCDRTTWIVIAVLTVFTYFFGLTIPLVGPDEPRYAQVAREMFERGDWVTPTLGGYTWFEKPALLYWLEIASYHLFGVSEFSARFGSALFGLGTILALWLIGKKSKGLEFANWTALTAASSIGLIVFSRGASFDIILTFPITAALAGFFVYDLHGDGANRRRSFLPLFLFYFFVGISLIAKGLIGIVFPYAIVGFYYLLLRRFPPRSFVVSILWGTLVSLLVACVWYVPVYLRNGYPFVDEFFVQHHFQRYLTNKYFHPQPFYFFFWVLPLMTIPWLPFFFAGLWKAVKGSISKITGATVEIHRSTEIGTAERKTERLLLFALAWLLVPLVFFSFSGSKLPGYILPALPPSIILSAFAIVRFVSGRPRRAAAVKATAVATMAMVVVLLIFAVPEFADGDSVKRLIATADEKGYSASNVVCMHHLAHNAEFYAAGRMVRDKEGHLAKLLGPNEVLDEIHRQSRQPLLVLVPLEYERQLTQTNYLSAEVLADNGEFAIVAVRSAK